MLIDIREQSMPAPLPANEDERLSALRSLQILDTPSEEPFDAACRTAAAFFQAPIALVSLMDADRQWFKARCGLDADATSREVAFCAYTILSDEILVVEDATQDARFRFNPLVTGEPGIRFYAGAPLTITPGLHVGTLCIIDTAPRRFSADQRRQLADLARTVTALLRLNQSQALAEAELTTRREREAFLASVLQASSDCIKVVDGTGALAFMTTNGLCAMEIDSFATVQGAEWASLWPNEARDQVRAAVENARAGRTTRFEAFCPTAKGTPKWWEVTVSPIREGNGQITRLVSVSRDVSERRRSSEALARNEERLRLALDATGLGIWDIDPRTGVRTWSKRLQELLGYDDDVTPSREAFLDRVHPEDRAGLEDDPYPALPKGGMADRLTYRIRRADNGEERWVELMGKTLLDDAGHPVRLIGTMQDFTPRRHAEEALRASEERLRLALQAGRMFAWERDLSRDYVERSANARDLIGLGSGPASDFIRHLHPEDRERAPVVIRGEWGTDAEQSVLRFIRPDGRMLWLAARSTLYREPGKPDRLIGVTFDISDRKAAEDAIWRTANHDPLTGLPNRALFQVRLEEALAAAADNGSGVGLILVDLDDFKDVNDTLGHDAGDALLQETARRLTDMVDASDTVARIGGDEFAVVLTAAEHRRGAGSFADEVAERLRSACSFGGRLLSTKASIGVATFPEHHREPAELMKDADIALYRAKAEGRGRAIVYTAVAREAIEQRVRVLAEVRQGLAADEFVPFYQPKVALRTGLIAGFEALARWRHPSKGVLTPGYFSAAFDDPEIAIAMGERIVRQVAADIRCWLDHGLDCGRVAVNLSSAECADPQLARRLLGILEEAGVPTRHVEVEVTETVFLERSAERASATLQELSRSGVTVALDDFGTGYASLTHLKQFPVNHIKVDQSFVRNLEADEGDAAIVAAVIGLGHNLGIEVTAEGVETVGQVERLARKGCDNVQGYLYAKPMVGSRVSWFLGNWKGMGHEERFRRA